MSKYIILHVIACCTLFTAIQSAPIYRERADMTECEPNDDSAFRDPSEILGIRFTRSTMADLCESKALISPGASTKKIQHTARGCRTCRDVCAQFRETVGRDGCGPARVSTLDAYCQLNGGDAPVVLEEMGSSCKCLYRVQTGKNTVQFPQYSFEVNVSGDVRVSVADNDCRRFVTATPSTAAEPCAA